MPKFAPAPRTPQNRSALWSSLAVTSSPSAVTRSTERRLSTVAPYLRISQPIPPPSVRPSIPVCRNDAADGGEPEVLRLAIELAPQHARLGARRPRCRVDPDAPHRREVDHEPAIAERMSADSVATGAHRDDQIALARVANVRDARRRRRRSARCRPAGGRSRRSRSCGRRHSLLSPARSSSPRSMLPSSSSPSVSRGDVP